MKTPYYEHLVRDSIHGNIPFNSLEKRVIDSPLFQRLRNLTQLGFLRNIFPCANHTRFEHSLGVMHIAGLLFDNIARNQHNLLVKAEKIQEGKPIPPELENTRGYLKSFSISDIKQAVRLAGLLHDLGHGPLSHVSEFLIKEKSFEEISAQFELPAYLIHSFEIKKKRGEHPTHEMISCIMIDSLFRTLFPDNLALLQDVLAIIDLDIELGQETAIEPAPLRYLLHDIISHEIDADRMDYLLRDSKTAGVNYGVFDIERLLANLCFTVNPKNNKPTLAVTKRGVHPLEHFLFGRYQMYMQVYTHKTNGSFEAMLRKLHKLFPIDYPLRPELFLEFNDRALIEKLKPENIGNPKLPDNGIKWELYSDIFEQLFHTRSPWKLLYEAASYESNSPASETYLALKEKLSKSKYGDLVLSEQLDKSLSGYSPTLTAEESRTFKVVEHSLLEKRTLLREISSESFLITAFQEKHHLYRIYAHPQYVKEIADYLNP